MNFTLSDEQLKQAKDWMSERKRYSGTAGGQFSYVFTPTGLGMIVKITDGDETLDLTDLSSW